MCAARKSAETFEKPRLERMSLLRELINGYRARLDEELQPLGITLAQLRMLWTVAMHPEVSGAEIARICQVTPQSGQATMARLAANGWVRRQPSASSDRVLVAELTARGKHLLIKAREIAEGLDRRLWDGIPEADLSTLEAVLKTANARLGVEPGTKH